MVIFSGFVLLLQIWLLTTALVFIRRKIAIFPDKDYRMWKLMAILSLIPLGIALFTFLSIRSLSTPTFLMLSVETLAMGLLILSLCYLRPLYLAKKIATRINVWKLLAILSIIVAVVGLFIPVINIL